MEAVQLTAHGEPDVLTVNEIDRPTPTANEVLVKVGAAGVNPVDTKFRSGEYTPVDLPFTPGVDVAGEVIDQGDACSSFEPGDRVFGTGIGSTSHQGAYAEFATVPEDRLVKIPPSVDTVTAGAAGVVAATAWRALFDHAGLQLGENCLIHGGSGGVGHVGVQLAAAAGATVVTTAAPRFHDRIQESFGASVVLDYDHSMLADAITEAADGGIDVILDHRCDAYLQLDATVAATGARIVGIGEASSNAGFDPLSAVRAKDLSYTFMSLFNSPDLRIPLQAIADRLEAGGLDIAVERTYSLDEAAAAHRDIKNESFCGKLVIVP